MRFYIIAAACLLISIHARAEKFDGKTSGGNRVQFELRKGWTRSLHPEPGVLVNYYRTGCDITLSMRSGIQETLEELWKKLWPKLEKEKTARTLISLPDGRSDGRKTLLLQFYTEPAEDLTRTRMHLIKNGDEVYLSEFSCRERLLNRLEPYYEETEAFFRSIRITPGKK